MFNPSMRLNIEPLGVNRVFIEVPFSEDNLIDIKESCNLPTFE